MKTGCRTVIGGAAAAALVVVMAAASAAPAWAHRTGRWHRHPVRRAARLAIFVGVPIVMARAVLIHGVPQGAIDFDVEPKTTEVHVNGALRGQVDDFDGVPGKLYLRAGLHRITLVTPEGDSLTRKVRIVAGEEINLKLDLVREDSGQEDTR